MTAPLIIVRGLPGSGKSTIAATYAKTHKHIEADQFFMVNGAYLFDPKKLTSAHNWCIEETKKQLAGGGQAIVSNTFTTIERLKPYLALSPETEVIKATGDFGNVHNVPSAILDAMALGWEPYDGETEQAPTKPEAQPRSLESEIEGYGKLQFTRAEIIAIAENPALFEAEENRKAYARGRLKAKAIVRQSLIKQAEQGSLQAQKEFIEMAAALDKTDPATELDEWQT